MSYSYNQSFYATVSAPTTLAEKIEIKGIGYSPDHLYTVTMEWFSHLDNKQDYLTVSFADLEGAFSYIEAHRNLAASVAKVPPLPYRVEIAGLDKDGAVTDELSFVITKNEGEKLPYRLQMYREGVPCGTYTDFRNVIDAIYEAGDLNVLAVSNVVRTEEYTINSPSSQQYRQSFYEVEDADTNGAIYVSLMERKNDAGEYEELPNWRNYHFNLQDINSTVEYTKNIIDNNRYVDVANVTVELDDSTRSLILQADVILPNGREPFTHTQTLSFDELVEEDWHRYADELAGMDGVTDNLAALYEVHKDDFYYNNQTYRRLISQFTSTLTLAATENTTKSWYELSPLALNEIREHNPSRETHSIYEEKQRTVKKDRSGEER